jgi:hypothetical protein
MKCPECQFDNRTGAKFCIECGNKLELKCSKCSHLNPSGSKFCEESTLSKNVVLINGWRNTQKNWPHFHNQENLFSPPYYR